MKKDIPDRADELRTWALEHEMQWTSVDPFGLSSIPFIALTSGAYDVAQRVLWGEWKGTNVVVFECLIGRFTVMPTVPIGAGSLMAGPSSLSLCAKVDLHEETGSLLMLTRDKESRRLAHRARQIHMREVPEFDDRWRAFTGDGLADPLAVCRRLRPFLSDGEVLEIHDASMLIRWFEVDVPALTGRLDRLLVLQDVASEGATSSPATSE